MTVDQLIREQHKSNLHNTTSSFKIYDILESYFPASDPIRAFYLMLNSKKPYLESIVVDKVLHNLGE